GDDEGVCVIPLHMADAIAQEAAEMTAFEDFVTEEVKKGRAVIGLYPATTAKAKADYAAWRKNNGR
ncbi:MAG: ribonuclease activity regulator RraA, partial [Rhodospirillales bacterium]